MKNERGAIKLITFIGVILILVLVLFALVVFNRVNSNDEANMTKEDTTEEDFTLSFLQLESNQENMIYSPLSIKYALKMLQEGASENTYTQIEKIAGSLDLPTYQNIENTLSLANAIFIRDTYYQYVKDDYKDILVNKYNAEITQDEFVSADNVNSWIEEKTFGKIENMLTDELVTDPNLQMLLINALAIDMEWETQFADNDTSGRMFYLVDGTEMTATTMSRETSSDDVSYYIGDGVTALTMDLKEYDGTQLEFMAIMPDEDLSQYIENLTIDEIDEITENLQLASSTRNGVEIYIPKFDFEYDLSLKEDLENLGMTDAFDSELADFSNMADLEQMANKGYGNLYVLDALHKANIEFSEEGVKAAAVTVFSTGTLSATLDSSNPIEININNPFLFLIRDKETKEIWFVGTVYEPNSWEDDKDDYSWDWQEMRDRIINEIMN